MLLPAPLDLSASLDGGQAFRWVRDAEGAYVGTLGARLVRLRQLPGGGVAATGAQRRTLERYFRIEPADALRRERLAKDEVLYEAVTTHAGLRLLRQEPWEATVGFLTSANNNVLRISGIMRALAARHGEEIEDAIHAFPSAAVLARARESDLRKLGLGYRAPFLRDTARLVAKGEVDLDALRGASWAEARETLLRLPGVGPKVADCIALFALDVDEAFPIDRWILRAVSETFFGGRALRPREVEAFARDRWGADAGLAQQFLFHAARSDARRKA